NRQVRAVTPEALRDTVRRYLTVENSTITLLVPEEQVGQIAALGRKLAGNLRQALAQSEEKWSAPASANAAGEVLRAQLPNGAHLIVKRDPTVSLVAMRGVWMGGLRYEDEK